MPYTISKDFEFSYGHRVWNQQLTSGFSDDLQCSCRHLHGHNAKVTLSLSAPILVRGMVTDFRNLEFVKKFLNEYVDHHFIIDRHDPLFATLVGDRLLEVVQLPGCNQAAGWTVECMSCTDCNEAELEMMEGFFIVDFVPTSENFSSWLAQLVNEKIAKLGVKVDSVTWWESNKSRSQFVF